MKYEFPKIDHINDILWAIEDCENIYVSEKDGYKVINYRMLDNDTFPPIKVSGGSAKMRQERELRNTLRRECRGLIFCSETGNLLRRPFHKFFNIGERTETLPDQIDISAPHQVLNKLDGSMIAPFILGGRVRYGTKMGVTDVAGPAEEFANARSQYEAFSTNMIADGFTPIFEWCSNKQRIVLNNEEDRLDLLAIRDMKSGMYVEYSHMVTLASEYGIQCTESHTYITDMTNFMASTKKLVDIEGFVVRFNDGHMVKMKCDWYLQIHKAKEKILYDRHVLRMVLENTLDDVKPHLMEADLTKIQKFENDFSTWFNKKSTELFYLSKDLKEDNISRKDFALGKSKEMNPMEKAVIFSIWDKNHTLSMVKDEMTKFIEKKIGSNSNYEEMQQTLFPDLKFN